MTIETLNFHPLGNLIMVKQDDKVEESDGGIVLAGKAQFQPLQGVVIAVGNGKFVEGVNERYDMSVRIGDIVMFGKQAGHEVDFNNETYIVMSEDELMGIIK